MLTSAVCICNIQQTPHYFISVSTYSCYTRNSRKYHAWFQASASVQIRFALFWDVTQRRVVIPCRRFGTACRSHLQGSWGRWGRQAVPKRRYGVTNMRCVRFRIALLSLASGSHSVLIFSTRVISVGHPSSFLAPYSGMYSVHVARIHCQQYD